MIKILQFILSYNSLNLPSVGSKIESGIVLPLILEKAVREENKGE